MILEWIECLKDSIRMENHIQLILLLFGWKIGLMYVASLPLLALLNWRYWLNLIKTNGRIKFKRLNKKGKLKEAYKCFNAINEQLGL